MIQSVLFVCSGNSCRSPMAEAMLRKMLGTHRDVEVSSAGLFALEGMRANENAIKAMAKESVDISGHRSNQLTREMVKKADLVVVMTREHKDAVSHLARDVQKKVFLLSDFEEDEELKGRDIPDPIAQPLDIYERCLAKMKSPLANLALRIVKKEI